MTDRARSIVYGLLLVAAFLCGWVVNGWRSDGRIAKIHEDHAEQMAQGHSAALDAYTQMERKKDEAIQAADQQSAKNRADADAARAAADGLRKQLAGMPARIAAASRAAVDEYAATAGELLSACTAEYQRVAVSADGHATDAQMMLEAWPRQSTEGEKQ